MNGKIGGMRCQLILKSLLERKEEMGLIDFLENLDLNENRRFSKKKGD